MRPNHPKSGTYLDDGESGVEYNSCNEDSDVVDNEWHESTDTDVASEEEQDCASVELEESEIAYEDESCDENDTSCESDFSETSKNSNKTSCI